VNVNSRRARAKNFSSAGKIFQFLAVRTCPVAAEYNDDNLLLKNDFVFSRYRGYILQVKWTTKIA